MSTQPSAPSKTSGATPLVQERITNRLADFPWWALIIALMAVFLLYSFLTDATYQEIITYLIVGVRLTIIVTLVSYTISMIIGLITAFAQMIAIAVVVASMDYVSSVLRKRFVWIVISI